MTTEQIEQQRVLDALKAVGADVKVIEQTPKPTKIKLAEQALASHRAKLASATDKDSVRRSIRAAEARLRDLRVGRE